MPRGLPSWAAILIAEVLELLAELGRRLLYRDPPPPEE